MKIHENKMKELCLKLTKGNKCIQIQLYKCNFFVIVLILNIVLKRNTLTCSISMGFMMKCLYQVYSPNIFFFNVIECECLHHHHHHHTEVSDEA